MKQWIEYILENDLKRKKFYTSAELREELKNLTGRNISDAELRQEFSELVIESDKLYCSCDEGFYLATNEEEHLRGIHYITSRFEPMRRRIERMKEKHGKVFDGQMTLKL